MTPYGDRLRAGEYLPDREPEAEPDDEPLVTAAPKAAAKTKPEPEAEE